MIELSFKTSQEISKIISSNSPEVQNAAVLPEFEEPKKDKITTDMIMEILCTFNQEGLGPLKWWNSEK